jgi:hypothetical protein
MPAPNAGALDPSEKPIIENIISLFQQLLAMQGSSASPGVGDVLDEEPAGDEIEKDVASYPKVNLGDEEHMTDADAKKKGKGEGKGDTNDADAETRLDMDDTQRTDVNTESMRDIKKAISQLTQLVINKQPVRKSITSVNRGADPVLTELRKLNDTLGTVVKAQQNQETLNGHLFDALGFSKDVIEKSIPTMNDNTAPKGRPIQQNTADVVKDILVEVFKAMPQLQSKPSANQPFNHPVSTPFSQRENVHKDLQGIADYIHGYDPRLEAIRRRGDQE